jgi:hypothetical protein
MGTYLSNSSYTILGAYKLSNGDSVLRLKNPYGPSEWTGKYFYGDQEHLTKEVKQEIQYTRHSWNKGIFHISIRDFVEFFGTVNVAHYRSSHTLSTVQDYIHSKTQFAYYQFSISETHSNQKINLRQFTELHWIFEGRHEKEHEHFSGEVQR